MVTKVADVMTFAPIAISSEAPFKAIAELLAANPFAAVPVVDKSRHVIGIITEGDLLLKEGQPGAAEEHHVFESRLRRRELQKAAGWYAGDIMTTPVHTIRAETSVANAAKLLHDRRINQVPVVDDGKELIGMVTRGDLLKTFLRSDADIVREVRDEIMVRKLWWERDCISVTAASGVIRLRGEVDRRSDVQIVVRLVQNLSGVVGVINQLRYRLDDKRSPYAASPIRVLPRQLQ